MKSRLVVAVLVLVVLASGAWAQGFGLFSPRASGMGGASIAVADDAAAWFQNPAGLAALAIPCKEGTEYGNDILFGFANNDENSAWELTWSGWKPSSNLGFGAGYANVEDVDNVFGAGFGAGFADVPLSGGINVMSVDPEGDDSQTILNVGALYRLNLGEEVAPLKIGMVVTDVTDEFDLGTFWGIGLAWNATKDLLVAVDFNDVTDELNEGVLVSGGAEYAFGSAREWRVRAGAFDDGDETNFTVGAGYQAQQWRADFSFVDTDPDATWSLGVGVNL